MAVYLADVSAPRFFAWHSFLSHDKGLAVSTHKYCSTAYLNYHNPHFFGCMCSTKAPSALGIHGGAHSGMKFNAGFACWAWPHTHPGVFGVQIQGSPATCRCGGWVLPGFCM